MPRRYLLGGQRNLMRELPSWLVLPQRRHRRPTLVRARCVPRRLVLSWPEEHRMLKVSRGLFLCHRWHVEADTV